MTPRGDVAEALLPGRGQSVVGSVGLGGAGLGLLARLRFESAWAFRVVHEGREVARCRIHSGRGEFDEVSVARDGSRAVVRWTNQTEAGLVLVELGDEPRQLDRRWETRTTNWLEGPVWAPRSDLLVLVENPVGGGPWWAEHDPGDADDDDASPGGTYSPGSVVTLDRDLRERFRDRVEVQLPPGWFPGSDLDRGPGCPAFIAPDEVVVRVPVDGERRLALRRV
jgi:hypothetical protein